MAYIYTLPDDISFRGKGFHGYSYGPMAKRDLEILYVESKYGHDTFMICRGVRRTYYVIAGTGAFIIHGREYPVCPSAVVEVPSGTEYSYSGQMTLLAICQRSWFRRSDKWTRWNRDVVDGEGPWSLDLGPWHTKLVRLRIFGKSPINLFLRISQRLWNNLPPTLLSFPGIGLSGHFLHALARIQDGRAQAFNTFFLRNRPELELIRRVVRQRELGTALRVAVLGCSTGPEVYSVAWAIRTVRPDLKLVINAVDISEDAVHFARRGAYSLVAQPGEQEVRNYGAVGSWKASRPGRDLVGSEIFERMTPAEMTEFFDLDGDVAHVKDWLKEGIHWRVTDVRAPDLLNALGPQDLVVASNFLCHMQDSEADRCLRNVGRLFPDHGYLFVSGVDLDIRSKVAQDLRWEPLTDLIEEIHEGDPCMRRQWPCQYGGVEPLNKRRPDWKTRYAAAFLVKGITRDVVGTPRALLVRD